MRVRICKQAEKLAKHNITAVRFKLAAIVSQGSRVYSHGTNVNKPQGIFPASRHAEESALQKVPVMQGGDIYVCRCLADGSLAMAFPCDNCMKLIREKGLDSVHYTGVDGQWHTFEVVHEE